MQADSDFDLLDALNLGNQRVLGASQFAKWRLDPREGLDIIAAHFAWPWHLDLLAVASGADAGWRAGASSSA